MTRHGADEATDEPIATTARVPPASGDPDVEEASDSDDGAIATTTRVE